MRTLHIASVVSSFFFLSFFPRLFWASNGNKAKVRVRRNVFWAKGLWTFRPTPMRQNIYGWIAHGAKCLVRGETSMGRNVHTWGELSMGRKVLTPQTDPP